MNWLQNINKIFTTSKVGKFAYKNAPQILMVFGAVSSVGTCVSIAVATKKSLDDLEVARQKRLDDGVEEALTKKEVVKECWKNWILPAGFFVGSTTAYFMAFHVEHGRCLAYASLLAGTESKLAALEAEMIEKLGEKKAEEIHTEAAQKIVNDKKIGTEESEAVSRGNWDGGYICYDDITGQEFKTTYDKIMYAISECNKFVDLNDIRNDHNSKVDLGTFLDLAGGKWTSRASKFVWEAGNDEVKAHGIGVKIATTLTVDREPCYVLQYSVSPIWEGL